MSTPTVTFEIPMSYLGMSTSKNHLWHGGRRGNGMNKEAKAWKGALADSVLYALLEKGVRKPVPPVTVEISGHFFDAAHAPDMHNMSELIADSIEEGMGVNDRHFSITTHAPTFGAIIPEITIKITVGVGEQ